MKHTLKKALIIPFLFLSLGINPQKIQAQPTETSSDTIKESPFSSLKMPDLPDGGEPVGRRKGGAGRPECPAGLTNLTAIVPGKEGKSFSASTTSENTSFWFYFPQVPSTVQYGEFILQEVSSSSDTEPEEKDIFRQQLTLPSESGFIGVSLPKLPQYALKENTKYHVYLKVFCDNPEKVPEYFYVDTFFKRVAITPELKNQLEKDSAKYKVFAANNLWVDTLDNLAQLRRKNPDNAIIQRDWIELLKVIDLGNIARNPIVKYYEFKNEK